jgi:hypothetical protein
VPYIAKGIRASLAEGRVPIKPGELNYLMSQLIKGYLAMNGISYTSLNAVVGVLDCLKMEVYRRLAVPYEDEKARTNGDVF